MIMRRAGAAEAGIVASFVDALLAELSGAPPRHEARLRTATELLAGDDRVFGFLAFEGDTPVGVIMLAESAAIYAGGTFGVITELYVVPEQRSAGVARRLVAAALEFGRGRSWGRLEVGAPRQPAWARSFQFYLREGFTEVGPRLKFISDAPPAASPASGSRRRLVRRGLSSPAPPPIFKFKAPLAGRHSPALAGIRRWPSAAAAHPQTPAIKF